MPAAVYLVNHKQTCSDKIKYVNICIYTYIYALIYIHIIYVYNKNFIKKVHEPSQVVVISRDLESYKGAPVGNS